jgi:hypothetical protein
MTRPYSTSNIEQAATIMTVTGIDPELSFDGTGRATFKFPSTSEVSTVVMQYESGIDADARTLLTVRNQLFRRVRGGAR